MSSTVNTNSNLQSMFSNQKPQPVPGTNQPMAPLNHPINKPSAPINQPTAPMNQPTAPMNQPTAPMNQPNAPMNQPASSAPGSGQNLVSPKRGKGILTQQRPGLRQPMCGACDGQIRLDILSA